LILKTKSGSSHKNDNLLISLYDLFTSVEHKRLEPIDFHCMNKRPGDFKISFFCFTE